MVSGDFDGDGLVDFAIAEDTEISVYFGNGDGTFRNPVLLSAPDTVDSIAAGDLDHDGHPDLFAYSADGTISSFLSRPFGRFVRGPSLNTGLGSLGLQSMVFGQFEGAGVDELAIATGSSIVLFRGTTAGWTQGTSLTAPVDMLRAADLDGDGWLDLVGLKSDGTISIIRAHCGP
jgi:hypothetical protein